MTVRLFKLTRQGMLLAAAAQIAIVGAPADAASTRLERCGLETCLLVKGRRADASAAVQIAGHVVAVRGRRVFSVSLPLRTVREWSAPLARSIMIRVGEVGDGGSQEAVRLPIGLLGHVTELAALDVRAP